MKTIAAAVLAGILFSSCAPSTPQARIEKNPAAYAALGSREKALVSQGQIARGMSPAAVQLAWGDPARTFEGSKNSRRTERWDYSASRPVYTTNYFGGFGYGYGGFGPYNGRYSAVGLGLGPEITYIPERVASVWFLGGRVDSWERLR